MQGYHCAFIQGAQLTFVLLAIILPCSRRGRKSMKYFSFERKLWSTISLRCAIFICLLHCVAQCCRVFTLVLTRFGVNVREVNLLQFNGFVLIQFDDELLMGKKTSFTCAPFGGCHKKSPKSRYFSCELRSVCTKKGFRN